jgi:hypothetical protein
MAGNFFTNEAPEETLYCMELEYFEGELTLKSQTYLLSSRAET